MRDQRAPTSIPSRAESSSTAIRIWDTIHHRFKTRATRSTEAQVIMKHLVWSAKITINLWSFANHLQKKLMKISALVTRFNADMSFRSKTIFYRVSKLRQTRFKFRIDMKCMTSSEKVAVFLPDAPVSTSESISLRHQNVLIKHIKIR